MTPDELQSLIERSDRAQRRQRLLLSVYTALALLLSTAWLAYTSREVSRKRSELAALTDSVQAVRAEVDSLAKKVGATTALLNRVAAEDSGAVVRAVAAQATDSSAARTVISRVYMHIAEEPDRAWAREAVDTLTSKGVVVLGIERRPERVRTSEVRYFHDADQPAAAAIADALKRAGEFEVRLRPLPRFSARVPRGQFEVWFRPDPGWPDV